jgi:Zn-finger nucleic acid-binding protein
MSEIFDDRKKALEEEYFRRKEREAIEKLRARMNAEEQAKVAEAAALHCPKCDGQMQGVMFEGIEIDACDKCGGIWLDAGEMPALMKRDERGWFGRLFGGARQSETKEPGAAVEAEE